MLIQSGSSPAVGDIYKYTSSASKVLFHAKVKSSSSVSISGTQYWKVEFEEVLGKIAHRWANWKYFYQGELYYKDGILHEASANGVVSYSASANLKSSLSLSRVSGTGPSSLTVDINSSRQTADGDPVVKSYYSAGNIRSGYELYDVDDVKYWKYLGWEAQNQRHVTRHQTNTTLDTASSVFDNINSLLKHFNGILRYLGKYSLSVESTAGTAVSINIDGQVYKPEEIDEGDIIGAISVEDAGQKEPLTK